MNCMSELYPDPPSKTAATQIIIRTFFDIAPFLKKVPQNSEVCRAPNQQKKTKDYATV